MSADAAELDRYVEQWWLWFAVALFFLIPLDLLTTLIAVAKYGTVVEANPIVRWLLQRGLLTVTVVNLGVVGIVVYLFHAAVGSVRQVPPSNRQVLVRFVNVWLAVLLVVGAVVVVNNIRAIV